MARKRPQKDIDASRPPRVVRPPAEKEQRCYVCGRDISPHAEVVTIHEALMHRACYEADIRRGR